MISTVRMLLLTILIPLALSACGNPATSGTDPLTVCSGWSKIRASASDTAGTLDQIEKHNATGRAFRCWG